MQTPAWTLHAAARAVRARGLPAHPELLAAIALLARTPMVVANPGAITPMGCDVVANFLHCLARATESPTP